MQTEIILTGKKILIADDEEDVLDTLCELLPMCKIDTAKSYEEAENLLENNDYDAAILDIMGIRGYDLLQITRRKNIPALMLTAHAFTKEHLKKSFEKGAWYYAPKEKMDKISVFLADVLDARDKDKNVYVNWYKRLSRFCEDRFDTVLMNENPEFWGSLLKY